MKTLKVSFEGVVKILVAIGTVSMLSAMLICVTNIVTRVFKLPILGTYEFIELSSVPAVSFAMIYAALTKSNVSMELLFSKLPKGAQRVFAVLFTLLCLLISVFIAWSTISYAGKQFLAGEVTIVMRWPVYPFRCIFGIGMALVSIVFAIELVKTMRGGRDESH